MSINSIKVKVNGEIKEPEVDYTLEENVLTFKVAPQPYDKIEVLKEDNGKTND